MAGTLFGLPLSQRHDLNGAPLARWSRAYSALARQPSARSMAGFEMASRNLANTMSARLGTSFTPADILRAMQGPVQAPAEEE